MIPQAAITAWGATRPWPTRAAIEQDLLLARTIVAIYEHERLREELVFRGGTCLHQVFLDAPRRYSEDLDFVRTTHGGIGPIFDDLREVAESVGLEVHSRDMGMQPKMRLRAPSEGDSNLMLRIKVEINTHDTSPASELIAKPFTVVSDWFRGSTQVRTFTPEELMATKIRALYQRKKGRDIFDLWLALHEMALEPDRILAALIPYRPAGYTSQLAVANLESKLADTKFQTDLEPLVGDWPEGFDMQEAGKEVIERLLKRV